MGQIVGGAAKPKRCNLNKLSQLGTPAAGEHILVSSDNSMNAAGQGNFDCYIVGNGRDAATALKLKSLVDDGVFDISTYRATGDVLAKYADIAAALDGGNNIPEAIRKGGMSVKFVQSSDNTYVQYFLNKEEWSVNVNDWEKVNLEGEVIKLNTKINELYGKEDIVLVKEAETMKKWTEVDGKVVLSDSSSVWAYHPVDISEYVYYELTSNISSLAVQNYFITDAQGNVLQTEIASSLSTFKGFAPAFASKIYINSVSTLDVSLRLGENVFKRLNEIEAKIKPEQIKSLDEYVSNFSYLVYKSIGNIDYIENSKKIIKITQSDPLLYDELTPTDDSIWLYNNHLFYWNGIDLVPAMTEQVIKLYAISTNAPIGITKGDYYYNSSKKKLYRNNGSLYNSIEIPLRTDTVFIYNGNFYLWNGTDLINKTDMVTVVSPIINESISSYQNEYGAHIIVDNSTPLELSETDFKLGNLKGGTGDEINATNVIRSGYIKVVPSSSITLHTENSYRHSIFEFKADKSWRLNDAFGTTDTTIVLRPDTAFVRFVIASPSGTQTAPVWEDAGFSATPNKIYEFTRAAAEETLQENVEKAVTEYFNLEEPILAPSPQLPANAEEDSDFNIETVTSTELHTAFSELIDKQVAYDSGSYYSSKNLNRYDVSGLDESGVYPIYTYVYGRRNRFAYRHSDELYAWKDGSDNIVYVDSTCPRPDDTIYSDVNRTDSGKTVLTYNSSSGVMTDSSSVSYTRDEQSNVDADMFWTKLYQLKSNPSVRSAFNKEDVFLGSASYVDSTHLLLNGKTYTRSECFDYHTDHKATIFIWANEHGPSSDPLEPSVVLYRFIKDLCGGCRNNKFIGFLKMYCKIVFIPCANPWGCQYPRVIGRQNSNGVNINRNYDTPGWSAQSDSDKGSYVGSESETQFIMNMCRRFTPDIALDVHCLGYVNPISEGLMYLSETYIPDNEFYQRAADVMSSFGFLFDQRGNPTPDAGAHGSEWLDWLRYIGGVFEMNAGDYNLTYNGKQHTSVIMEACYTEFLNCIRMWYAKFDPTLDLSRLSIK